MSTGRFYTIQIGTVHLTSTGENDGIGCKLEVPNVEDLLTNVAGVAIPSITGAPVFQTIPWTSGKQFDIRIEVLPKQQWEDLKTLLNNSLAAGASFNVIGTGEIGNFNVTARAFPQKPFSAGSFSPGRIKEIVLRLITV
ncbi:MAG TPA: hypothetical protein VF556_05560 [Pyrinomonadaceae bacterium]|jgi:hypothetical protein